MNNGFKSKEEYSKNGFVFLSGQPTAGALTESRMFADLYGSAKTQSSFDLNRWQKMAGVLKG